MLQQNKPLHKVLLSDLLTFTSSSTFAAAASAGLEMNWSGSCKANASVSCENSPSGPELQHVVTVSFSFSPFFNVSIFCRSRSVGGLGRMWGNSCSQNRLQEPRGRHRLSTVIQPLRQNAGEVVDLTVDEDGNTELVSTKPG